MGYRFIGCIITQRNSITNAFACRGERRLSEAEPSWSPDGKYIVYSDHQNYSVFVINIDGSDKKYIGLGESPKWTPDSQQIVYHIGGVISKRDLREAQPKEIYESSVNITEFALSNLRIRDKKIFPIFQDRSDWLSPPNLVA